MKSFEKKIDYSYIALHVFWLILAVCFIYLASVDLTLQQQSILCWGLVALLIVAKKNRFFHEKDLPPQRHPLYHRFRSLQPSYWCTKILSRI